MTLAFLVIQGALEGSLIAEPEQGAFSRRLGSLGEGVWGRMFHLRQGFAKTAPVVQHQLDHRAVGGVVQNVPPAARVCKKAPVVQHQLYHGAVGGVVQDVPPAVGGCRQCRAVRGGDG